MARWMHPLVAALIALLVAWAQAPSAVAQPASGSAKAARPVYPKLQPVDYGRPLLPYCSPADRDKTIADIEAEIAKAEANVKALNAYYDATDDLRDPPTSAEDRERMRSSRLLRDTGGVLDKLKAELALAKSRKVVDCRTPRTTLPPFPVTEHVPWTPRSGICDPKAAADYIAELTAALHAELANISAIETYLRELRALRDLVAAGVRFKDFKPALEKAINDAIVDGERGLAEANANYDAVSTEQFRAQHHEPIKCPEPKAAPKPAGPGGVDDGPAPGPKPPPKPKGKPTFPLPGPDPSPATPKPPGDGPKAPAPAPGPGAFHIPWTPQRPLYQDIKVPGIPVFCDELARNDYLTNTLTPAIEAANHNVELSNNYLTWLGEQFALGNKDGWPTSDLIAIQEEIKAVNEGVKRQQAFAAALQARFQAALKQPLSPDCPKPRASPLPPYPPPIPRPPEPPPPPPPGDEPKAAPKPPGEKTGCDCPDRAPIAVGPNNRVGSGARTREKAVSTAMGLVGGLIGGGHGGGGGGGGARTARNWSPAGSATRR